MPITINEKMILTADERTIIITRSRKTTIIPVKSTIKSLSIAVLTWPFIFSTKEKISSVDITFEKAVIKPVL